MSKGRSGPPDMGARASAAETSDRRRRRRSSGDSPGRLRRVRDCLGLSQRDMAAELDVAHGAVGLWESGARPVPGPVLRLISLYEEDLGLSSAPAGEQRPLEALSVSRTSRNAKLFRTAAGVAARTTVLALG